MARGVNAIVLAAGLLTACATIADDGRRPGTGCECVLIGNSAVRSVATELEAHAVRCGYLHHKPFVAFADTPAVSPQQLWARIGENEGAKAALKGGTTSIFVMAWDESCGEADDFRDWIELALAYNPGIAVCIVAPWPRHRGMTYTEARDVQNEINARLHATVAELRANYPQLDILCIPQGDGMLELWRLYEEGRLPGVDGVYKTIPDDAGHYLYAGNEQGGPLALELAGLLWLAAVYGFEVRSCPYASGGAVNLSELAYQIVQAERAFRAEASASGTVWKAREPAGAATDASYPQDPKVLESQTFFVTDDSYTDGTNTVNFGSEIAIGLQANRLIGWLRFEIADIPSNAVLDSVTVQLRSPPQSFLPQQTTIHRVADTAWRESTITGANRPEVGDALDTVGDIIPEAWHSFDVTEAYAGNGAVSFALTDTTTLSDRGWWAKELGFAPRLIVTYDTENHAPSFGSAVYEMPGAVLGTPYTGSIAGYATDPNPEDVLTYSRACCEGGTWLVVAPDGQLSGTPGVADLGTYGYTVRVQDPSGASDTATLRITVETKDSDDDGVPDHEDAFPNNPNETTDTDGDGMGDNFEEVIIDFILTDRLETVWDVLPGADFDYDGQTNLEEFLADSDPTDGPFKDTDLDGVPDYLDAFPLNPRETTDADGDGMGDNFERRIINFRTNDIIETLADVLPQADFDNDGLTNLFEFIHVLDPTDGPFEGSGPVPGDVDGSGQVNAVDIQLVIVAALGMAENPDADVNADGNVDALDIQLVINAALGLRI